MSTPEFNQLSKCMDFQDGDEDGEEGMYYDCPCCSRTNIYVGDLLFCGCGAFFCIHCDMIAESMRVAHPNWPCPLCNH